MKQEIQAPSVSLLDTPPDGVFQYPKYLTHVVGHRGPYSGFSRQIDEPIREIDVASTTLTKLQQFPEVFDELRLCPYCRAILLHHRLTIPDQRWAYDDWIQGQSLYGKCLKCNWWYIQEKSQVDSDQYDDTTERLITHEGIITSFDLDSWGKHLRAIDAEICEYRRGLKSLNPLQVEKVVGDILSQYFHCEVRHVGRSHDGGIDLIVVKSDKDVAVQVKHRHRSEKAEGVAFVREFVGALVGEGFSGGIFVTTASSFSKEALSFAERVTLSFAPINLVSVGELRSLLNNRSEDRWRAFFSVWEVYEKLAMNVGHFDSFKGYSQSPED